MVLLKKTDYNTKIAEIEGKIPDVANLTTKTALTTVENEIPDISNLVKKKKIMTLKLHKLNNLNHDKYITTLEFNTLAADVFNARLSQANLVKKTDSDALLSSFSLRVSANTREILIAKDKLNKLKTFDSSYFIGKSHFEEDGT